VQRSTGGGQGAGAESAVADSPAEGGGAIQDRRSAIIVYTAGNADAPGCAERDVERRDASRYRCRALLGLEGDGTAAPVVASTPSGDDAARLQNQAVLCSEVDPSVRAATHLVRVDAAGIAHDGANEADRARIRQQRSQVPGCFIGADFNGHAR